jgi:Eukaryotic initiation factor 4E
MIEYGMFFLMQDGIQPVWEDPSNINGGVLSWRVETKAAYTHWKETVIHYIANSIFTNFDTNSLITGICISPKRNFNIIKMWTNKMIDYTKLKYATTLSMADQKAMFKLHRNSIEKDKLKDGSSGGGGSGQPHKFYR